MVLNRRVAVLGWVAAIGIMVVQSCTSTTRPRNTEGEAEAWSKLPEDVAARPAPVPFSPASPFLPPPELRAEIDFWKDIFARYSRHQVVIHDSLHLDRVYSVLDFRPLVQRGLSAAEIEQHAATAEKREKERIRAMLVRLHQNGGRPLNEEEERIVRLFARDPDPKRFLHAAAENRIRGQVGLRERFAAGIEIGHAYFPEMEAIFREEGVPVEITRLPLIESTFNIHAYSKRGAAGVWQFIPSTGRRFMRIDEAIDERRDPIIAARAAARFMKENYRMLGSWPLAIAAYNHGPGGIARAVREMGTTDIVTIIRRYQGPAFKFASRNFYPEFLAALEVEREHARYFGPLALRTPVRAETVRLPDYVGIETVARCAGTTPEEIAALNPSFSRAINEGKLRIPRDYPIRIPAGVATSFKERYAALPPEKKHGGQVQTFLVHRVQRGQTLSTIARHYGRSVGEIRRHNNLGNSNVIRTGQVLRIPSS